MRKFKKIVFVLCMLCIALGIFPLASEAAVGGNFNDAENVLKFTVLTEDAGSSTGTVSVAVVNRDEVSYTIPKTVANNGITYSVTEIAYFDYCEDLISITIPNSIQVIGNGAFNRCTALTEVIFEDTISLERIGRSAFFGCTEITEMTIPDSVVTIETMNGLIKASPFAGCTKLESITFGAGIQEIGDYMFYAEQSNETSLKSVTLGSHVETIGVSAFKGCQYLTSIVLPDSVTRIGRSAFSLCYDLSSVTLASSIDVAVPEMIIENNVFSACQNLTSVDIPDKVTAIGDFAFDTCVKLETVNLGSNPGASKVSSIGERAFYGSELAEITIPDGVTVIAPSAFGFIKTLKTVNFSGNSALETIGNMAFMSSGLESFSLPDGVRSIGDEAFAYNESMTHFSIGASSSLESVGDEAFEGCLKMSAFVIPDSVTGLGEGVFGSCPALESVAVEAGNISFVSEDGVLYNALKSTLLCYPAGKAEGVYVLPSTVTTIPDGLFNYCNNLSVITVEAGNLEYASEEGVLYNVSKSTLICYPPARPQSDFTVPSSVETIPLGTFFQSVYLTDIAVAAGNVNYSSREGVLFDVSNTQLVYYPSMRQDSLYTVPQGTLDLMDFAFYKCDYLENIVIKNDLSTIRERTFIQSEGTTVCIYEDSENGRDVPAKGWNYKYILDEAVVAGVVAPVTGAVPVSSVTETDQYAGTVTWSGGPGTFAANTAYTATITLIPKAGYTFIGVENNFFTVAGGAASHTAHFGTITVVFPTTAGGGSGSSGSGSGSGGVSTPSTTLPLAPATISMEGTKTISTVNTQSTIGAGGHAEAVVSNEEINEALKKALEKSDLKSVVEIKVEGAGSATRVLTTVPSASFKELSRSGLEGLRISTPLASITFDGEALVAIGNKVTGDMKIDVAVIDPSTLSEEKRQAIGGRPVYDFTLTSGNDVISHFGGGKVRVTVPYALVQGEEGDKVIIYYLNDKGELELVPDCYLDTKTGMVTFVIDHFSSYVVGYNDVTFLDVSGWSLEYVNFLAARGVINGTGQNIFSPSDAVTRGQFVTMLAKLSGDDLEVYRTSAFTDVLTEDWYFKSVQWAYEKGVVRGSMGKFNPMDKITREQMTVMLYNYAQMTKNMALVNGSAAKAEFADQVSISEWALSSVQWASNLGVVSGNSDKSFAPQVGATREEAAKMVAVMLRLMVD